MLTYPETCQKKRSFPDVFSAVWWGEKRNLSAYQCNVCRKWHLTSRVPWKSYDRMQREDKTLQTIWR